MRVALIGLGMVASTHVAAIHATQRRVTLRGVLSSRPETAHVFVDSECAMLPERPVIFGSVDEIAADPEVDFVIICTPPNARMALVERLAAAGKPILMEKPIERDSRAAEQIVALCEASKVPLGIVLQHRVRASSKKLAAMLAGNHLGSVALAEITVPWWRPQSYYDEPGRGTYSRDGGGVLISQAIHTLDLALSLMGAVGMVQATARTTSLHNMESEDFVTAGFEFESGAIGSLVASTASFPGGAESIVLHCSNASVRLQSGQLHIAWRDGRKETIGEATGTGGGADPMAFTHQWHQGIIEDFADALSAKRKPMVTGREALATHKLIDALVVSSKERRAIDLSQWSGNA